MTERGVNEAPAHLLTVKQLRRALKGCDPNALVGFVDRNVGHGVIYSIREVRGTGPWVELVTIQSNPPADNPDGPRDPFWPPQHA